MSLKRITPLNPSETSYLLCPVQKYSYSFPQKTRTMAQTIQVDTTLLLRKIIKISETVLLFKEHRNGTSIK